MDKTSALLLAVAAACISLSTCSKDTSGFTAPEFTVNLDISPEQRWKTVASTLIDTHGWDHSYGRIVEYLDQILPHKDWEAIDPELSKVINTFPGDYPAEIKGLYDVAVAKGYGKNLTLGQLGFMQLFYELNNVCTSIVAQHNNGTIFHARNLDYGLPGLQNITATIHFQRRGETVFTASQYVGYMGVLTGMRPGGWAVSVDQRFTVEIPLIPTIMAMLKGAGSVGFTLRDALTDHAAFTDAIPTLKDTYLNSPVYLIVSGVNNAEGTVLTRNRNGTDERKGRGDWRIDPDNGVWYRLETNFDNWSPFNDGRRGAANKMMKKIGRDNIGFDTLMNVLSTPPVLADDATYTALMSAHLRYYTTFVRTRAGDVRTSTMSLRTVQLWRATLDAWLVGNGYGGLADRQLSL